MPYNGKRSGGGFGGKKFGGSKFGAKKSWDRGGSSGRGGSFSRGGSDRSMMHDATCGQCGKSCQVPFKPSGSRPVFCGNCFNKEEYSAGKERRGSDARRPSYQDRSSERSSYDSRSAGTGSGTSSIDEQIKKINAKLDRILEAMQSLELE